MSKQPGYVRFTLAQRIEHFTQLVSFTVLAITGVPQKFATEPWAEAMIAGLGGIELVRIVHRASATVLLIATVYHLVLLGYKLYVTRTRLTMLPGLKDAIDAWQVFAHNIGLTCLTAASTAPRAMASVVLVPRGFKPRSALPAAP